MNKFSRTVIESSAADDSLGVSVHLADTLKRNRSNCPELM